MAKVLSVEIGASLIYMCEADYKSKSPRVYKRVTIPTPENTIGEDGIHVNDALISAMKEGMRTGKIHEKKMVFTMNSTKIASREVVIPYVKENKVGDVIRANASDFFPVDLEQYELAYTVMGILENDKGAKQYKVQVLAAPKTMIAGYHELAKALGGSVEALDYSGNSIAQMIHAQCDVGVQMVIKIGEKSSVLTILKDSEIALQRNISYGIHEAVETVIHSSFAQDTSYMQALDVLLRNNCLEGDFLADEDGIVDMDGENGVPQTTQEEVSASLNYLVNAISRVVDYYNSRNSESVIEKVYVTGIGGELKGMEEFLSQALDLKVAVLRELEGFHLEKSFKNESFGRYLTCIGATIKPLGFLGETTEKKNKVEMMPDEKSVQRIAVMVLVGGILVAVALSATSLIRYEGLKNENTRLQQRIVELEPIKNVYTAYLQQKYTFDKVNFFYNSTVTPNEQLVEFIEEMEAKMPYTIYVESFNSTLENVSLSLSVRDKREAAMVIRQFRTFATIDPNAIVISGLTDTGAVMDGQPLEGEPQVSFTVTLTFRGGLPGEPQAETSTETSAEAADQDGQQ